MFHKSRTQTFISLGATLGLLLGGLIWVILLLQGAQLLRHRANASQTVRAGTLHLTTIRQKTIEGGRTISFSLSPNLLWYLSGCILIGGSIGYVVGLHKHLREPKNTAKER